jgi:sodium-dependent dicarboxylate transporter 2/3/5
MKLKIFALGFGLFLFVAILCVEPPQTFFKVAKEELKTISIEDKEKALRELVYGMKCTLALLVLMVVWWVTEALPIPVVALLPGFAAPIMGVVGLDKETASLIDFDSRVAFTCYANRVIFLLLGGFLIAAAARKWGLDRRITLWILSKGKLAESTKGLLLVMMGISALLSMWISNTATTAMMLPIGLGLLSTLGIRPGESRYGTILLLGIAYAASIGGVGTLIGTPPNAIAVGILSKYNFSTLSFLEWMKVGLPYVFIFIPLSWFILIKLFPPEIRFLPGGKEQILQERKKLGKPSRGEINTAIVFTLAALMWITNPFWRYLLPEKIFSQLAWVDEYIIAMFCGILLFLMPVSLKHKRFTLEWNDSKSIDWGTLILLGGGIALSNLMFKTGLAKWLAISFVGLFGKPPVLLLVFIVVLLIDFLTEITSNTAVTSMMLPVLLAIATQSGSDPTTLAITAAMGSSMAFMLPVATPPNALVYGTGAIKLKDMIKTGIALDIAGWFLTVFVAYIFGYKIFGIFRF